MRLGELVRLKWRKLDCAAARLSDLADTAERRSQAGTGATVPTMNRGSHSFAVVWCCLIRL